MWRDGWRGAHQADAEDGQTTSPQSPSSPLPVPSVQVPVSSSSPGHPRNPALDRSKSAPASLLQPSQVGSTLSGSSQSQPHFPGPPVPESPCLLDKQPVNQEALRQAPVPKSVSSSTPLQDHSPSFVPEGEYSPGLGGVECSLPSAMELNSGTGEEMLPSLFAHSEFSLSSLPMEPELDKVTDTSDAKKINVVSGPSEREGVAVQMEGIGSEIPLNPSPTPATTSNSKAYSESGPCSSATTEFPVATDAVPRNERDQPEGERKSNSDTVPSLAAALLELHELLVSNRLALPQDRSPTPSHSCREDADGVDEGPVAESQAPSPRNTQPAPGEADTEARSAIPDGPFPDDRSPLTPSTSDSSGQEASLEGGLQMVHSPDTGRERKACETGTGLGSEPEEVSLAQPSLQVREPPEGQQGRGVADGRAAGPDPLDPPHFPVEVPSPMETSPQSPLPAAMNAPCLLVMPDEDPNSSVVTLPPHPPASLPTPLPPLQPASPLTPPSPTVPVPPPPPLYTLPSPVPPLSEQFPAAHIQRIQAAGFSAEEAADALEQAQGNLELALLMLLARKITVPPRS